MPITTVQGKLLPLELSVDAGVTWKKIVCLVTSPFRSTKATTSETSQCGTHTAIGEHTWGFDVTAIFNTTPTTASELSGEDMLAMHINDVKPVVRMQLGTPGTAATAGESLYISGSVYIADFGIDNPETGLTRFTARLEGDGVIDIVA